MDDYLKVPPEPEFRVGRAASIHELQDKRIMSSIDYQPFKEARREEEEEALQTVCHCLDFRMSNSRMSFEKRSLNGTMKVSSLGNDARKMMDWKRKTLKDTDPDYEPVNLELQARYVINPQA
jgi:hypothetical protein